MTMPMSPPWISARRGLQVTTAISPSRYRSPAALGCQSRRRPRPTISNERSRAAWSKIWPVSISSSAPVASRIASSPRRTVSGEPTTETRVIRSTLRPLGGAPAALHALDRRRERPGVAPDQLEERLLERGEQAPRLRVGVGRERR